MANYSLSNAWENARQRLALLEQYSRSNYTQTLIRLGVGQRVALPRSRRRGRIGRALALCSGRRGRARRRHRHRPEISRRNSRTQLRSVEARYYRRSLADRRIPPRAYALGAAAFGRSRVCDRSYDCRVAAWWLAAG